MKFITLENNKECVILEEFNFNNEQYILLANSTNGNDLTIRKVKNNNLVGLDSEEEFNYIINLYLQSKTQ